MKADALSAFHFDTTNFRLLTPPTTKVVRPPSPDVREGVEFDLLMREFGLIPIRWPGVWDVVEPGRRMIDSLRKPAFPFARWRHEHRFEDTCDGCILTDDIRFSPLLPAGLRWLATPFAAVLKIHLSLMFAWRHRVTRSSLVRSGRDR